MTGSCCLEFRVKKMSAFPMYFSRWILTFGCLCLFGQSGLALDVKAAGATLPAATPAAVQARLRDGEQALDVQRWDVAKASFEAAIQAAPQDAAGWLGLSRWGRMVGDFGEAQRTLARAQALSPGSPAVLRATGQLAADQRQYVAAEAAFQAVVRADPRNVQAVADLAAVMGKNGRAEDARRMLDDAQKGRTVSMTDMLSLASAYQVVGQPHAALALFDKVLLARPESLIAQTGRGDSLYMLGRYAPALDAYLLALGLAAPGPQLHFKRARTLEAMQWLPEAEAGYRDALRLDPAHVASHHALRALALQRGESLNEVLALARQGVAQSPTASMYDVLGAALLARKDNDGARKALAQAVALAPDRDDFRRRLAAAGGAASAAGQVAGAVSVAGIASAPTAVHSASVVMASGAGAKVSVASAPAAGKPAALPAAAPGAAVNDAAQQVLAERLAQWAAAWSAKDASRYLSFYGTGFEPAKRQSRNDWERERRARLGKPGSIRVQVASPVMERQGDVVKVTFSQDYEAADYKDSARKQLVWILEAGQWRIRSEAAL